jgi:3',5'-cyclic AMP phosphodiesterase CpdA
VRTVVIVPGNHDARHVGYLQFERIFGARDVRLRLTAGDTDPRTWPAELSNLYVEPFVPAERGPALAND